MATFGFTYISRRGEKITQKKNKTKKKTDSRFLNKMNSPNIYQLSSFLTKKKFIWKGNGKILNNLQGAVKHTIGCSWQKGYSFLRGNIIQSGPGPV